MYVSSFFNSMASEKVWCKFSVKKSDGVVVNLRIQDLPSNLLDDAVDVNIRYFTPEETFHRAAGIPNNPAAISECREFVTEMFKDPSVHIVICCLDDDDTVDQILGVSIMALSTNEDDEMGDLEFQTKEVKKYFELLDGYFSLYDVMKRQNISKCFDGRGIVVHPDYRGLGIAKELFKMRREMCKHYGVPVTCAWMTSYGSQKAAQNDGWKTVCEFFYEEFGAKHGVEFTDVPPSCKLMLAKVL